MNTVQERVVTLNCSSADGQMGGAGHDVRRRAGRRRHGSLRYRWRQIARTLRLLPRAGLPHMPYALLDLLVVQLWHTRRMFYGAAVKAALNS